jgi:hypothetical protein
MNTSRNAICPPPPSPMRLRRGRRQGVSLSVPALPGSVDSPRGAVYSEPKSIFQATAGVTWLR